MPSISNMVSTNVGPDYLRDLTLSKTSKPQRLIVDAHEDISFNSVVLGRDFLSSAYDKRALRGRLTHKWERQPSAFPSCCKRTSE